MMLALPMTIAAPDGSVRRDMLRLARDATVRGPLVSCLMVSRGRRSPARFAIDCYRRQSYAQRELVIVTGGRDNEVGALVRELGDTTIRYVEVEPRSLGELRNASVAHARGDLVCHWDDDDLSHVHRLALQVAALGATGARACFLARVLVWWPARRLLRLGAERLWEGSMLADRAVLPAYPAWPREEDLHVVGALTRLHATVSLECAELYCYAVHGGNTNAPAHFEAMLRHAAPLSPAGDYAAHLARLAPAFPLADYAAEMGLA